MHSMVLRRHMGSHSMLRTGCGAQQQQVTGNTDMLCSHCRVALGNLTKELVLQAPFAERPVHDDGNKAEQEFKLVDGLGVWGLRSCEEGE